MDADTTDEAAADRAMQRAGSASPHLDEGEQGQAAAAAAPRALVIHEIVREEGETAISRTAPALLWSGLAAGLSMGFSFLAQSLLRADLPDAPWRHLIDSFGYSVGFIIVILGRQQLFTESTLTAVLPVLVSRSRRVLFRALRLWAIVLLANLVGAWIIAALLTVPGVFDPAVTAAMRELAVVPLRGAFLPTLLRAVFAGWLIAMMVWLLPSARSARLLTVLLITYIVAVGRLSHIIAGTVDTAYAVLTGAGSVSAYLGNFLAPTLLGNTAAGVALVALLNHAAIAPELGQPHGADAPAEAD
jgi:formate/nitrite transporter FocA (FNT family)